MDLALFFADKTIKSGARSQMIADSLSDATLSVSELISFANHAKDAPRATCTEALEYVTKLNPSFADNMVWEFVVASLDAKAPRVRWESAKVIGNIAHLFTARLHECIGLLLANSEHTGTVVRWSAAYAISSMLRTGAPESEPLIAIAKSIPEREEKNSIRKMYLAALNGKNVS